MERDWREHRISCGKGGAFQFQQGIRTNVLTLKNVSFLAKLQYLRQKQKKKTLAFYVNRIYTERHGGVKWSEIPVNNIKVGEEVRT